MSLESFTSLPYGEVSVTCPGNVVGTISPPVIPYINEYSNYIFSPLVAAWTISAVPIAARSPSP